MTERLANNAQTTLVDSIDDVDDPAVFNVAVPDNFPVAGNFRVIIDGEILLVTAVSGNEFTAVRAQEGTSIATHAAGVKITHIMTAGGMTQFVSDRIGFGLVANRPAAGQPNRIYLPSDGVGIDVDDGSVWRTLSGVAPTTTPILTDFTWVNQGGATATQTNQCIDFNMPPSGSDQLRFLAKAPSTSPTDVTISFQALLHSLTFNSVGMYLYDTGTGSLLSYMLEYDAIVTYKRWNSVTAFNGEPNTNVRLRQVQNSPLYLRYREDATDRFFMASIDNYNWITLHTESRTAFITVDRIGFGMQMNGAGGQAAVSKFLHFQER
jgi:hypothetical protein